MMEGDYSNRTLAYLLLVALVISIAGTLFTLNKMGGFGVPLITGSATSDQGNMQVIFQSQLSIGLVYSAIDFGICRPNTSLPQYSSTIIDSNDSTGYGTGEGQCDGLTGNKNITVENTGSEYANVTVQTTNWNLTGGFNKSLYFAFRNDTTNPGCYRGNWLTWTNFTLNNTEYQTCQNLTWVGANRRYNLFLRVYLPMDAAVGTRSATLTFTAHNVVT